MATSSSLFDSEEAVENGLDDIKLPVYCFKATPVMPHPSKCVPSNAEYAQLCQEVDTVTDQFILEMKNVLNGGMTKIEMNFCTAEITCKPGDESDLVIGVKESLRYCFITESDTLIISYWDKDFRGTVKNIILSSDNIDDSIKVLNCIRKMIFMSEVDQKQPFRLHRFFPLINSKILVHKTSELSTCMGDVTDDAFKELFVTVDEEVILVYGEKDICETPMCTLKFSKEQRDDAIDRIYAHTVSKSVEIETAVMKFFFKSTTSSSEAFKIFSFYVQGRILPKLLSMFNFTDASEFNKYMATHPLEDYSNAKPQFVPAKMPEEELSQMSQKRDTTSTEARVRTENREADGAAYSIAGGSDDAKLNDLIRKLRTSGDEVQGLTEDIQMMWITIESDIEEKLKSGLVPESSIKSGGLDPNSSAHFEKCIDEVQGALISSQVDRAVSHMQGCEEIFSKSDNTEVVQWLKNFSVVDRLRHVFLAGTKG